MTQFTTDDLIFMVEVICLAALIALALVWAQELGFIKVQEDDDAE